MSIIEIYKNHIYNRFKDLLRAKKIEDLDNKDLSKIFTQVSAKYQAGIWNFLAPNGVD